MIGHTPTPCNAGWRDWIDAQAEREGTALDTAEREYGIPQPRCNVLKRAAYKGAQQYRTGRAAIHRALDRINIGFGVGRISRLAAADAVRRDVSTWTDGAIRAEARRLTAQSLRRYEGTTPADRERRACHRLQRVEQLRRLEQMPGAARVPFSVAVALAMAGKIGRALQRAAARGELERVHERGRVFFRMADLTAYLRRSVA